MHVCSINTISTYYIRHVGIVMWSTVRLGFLTIYEPSPMASWNSKVSIYAHFNISAGSDICFYEYYKFVCTTNLTYYLTHTIIREVGIFWCRNCITLFGETNLNAVFSLHTTFEYNFRNSPSSGCHNELFGSPQAFTLTMVEQIIKYKQYINSYAYKTNDHLFG